MRNTASPKPLSQIWRPELTRLPSLTERRRRARRRWRKVCQVLVRWLTRTEVRGLEHLPASGPALVVVNHLGDADVVVGLAYFPWFPEVLAKAELYDFPLLGWLMEAYGVIWVHRGQPDRRALRAALQALEEGRIVGLAPEGRQSQTGELEEGMGGAAYLAFKGSVLLKRPVPIVPVAFTGTEDSNVYGSLLRLRRPRLTMTVGPAFYLEAQPDRRERLERGTQTIMEQIAKLLPAEYRGYYGKGPVRQ